MSTALALLFAAVPIIAALSLHMDTFVPFFILFCVSAGLTISGNERHAGNKPISRRPQTADYARF
jgi:hypothetical protein